MRSLGVQQRLRARRPGPVPAAARDARRPATRSAAGIDVAGARQHRHRRRSAASRARSKRSSPAARRRCSSPAAASPGAARCGRHCTAPTRSLLLLGSSAMASEPFTSQHRRRRRRVTYLTTPLLARAPLPASGPARARATTAAPSAAKPGPWALYGYEAMSVVLDAIRAPGRTATTADVIDALLRHAATATRCSAATRSQPDGETTLSRYGVDRVARRPPVFCARDRHAARTGAAARLSRLSRRRLLQPDARA